MSSLFSPDSLFYRTMSRVADLMLLNLCFLITSIPIITIGASTAALYTVCFRFDTEREEGTTKSYFKAFRENFGQATGLWIIMLLVLGTAFLNAAFFYTLGGLFHLLWIVFAALLVLAVFIVSYAFPLMSQFESRNKLIFKNSLILSIAYLPRSIVMGVLNVLPIALALTNVDLFIKCGFIWFMLYFGIAAYLNMKLLKKVFKPFYDRAEEPEEEASPALEEKTETQEETL